MLWRHVCALETWYMLRGHKRCRLVGEEYVFLLEKNVCLLVGEEYMSSCGRRNYVFLLEKNIWICRMSYCWRRIYGYGRCLLVGVEYMGMLLKTFQGALRLAAGVFFVLKIAFSEK